MLQNSTMHNRRNLEIYQRWTPVYDLVFQPLFADARRQLIAAIAPQPGEKWLIPGVGTGQDLPAFPPNVEVVASDLSAAMLTKALTKYAASQPLFHLGDAQYLPFANASFDGVLLNLILSVVPDGALAFRESWRVLKPGGRMGIFDKFLPEGQVINGARRVMGHLIEMLGTDPNRRFAELIDGIDDIEIVDQQPSLLAGQYQMIRLYKRGQLA